MHTYIYPKNGTVLHVGLGKYKWLYKKKHFSETLNQQKKTTGGIQTMANSWEDYWYINHLDFQMHPSFSHIAQHLAGVCPAEIWTRFIINLPWTKTIKITFHSRTSMTSLDVANSNSSSSSIIFAIWHLQTWLCFLSIRNMGDSKITPFKRGNMRGHGLTNRQSQWLLGGELPTDPTSVISLLFFQ